MGLNQTETSKNLFKVNIKFPDLVIDKQEIELSLGYSENSIPSYFSEMTDEILDRVPLICRIKAGYTVLDVKKPVRRNDGLFVGDKFFQLDKIVTGQLKKSDKAALFIATIGNAMERWSKDLLKEGDPLKSFIIDTVASVTAESVTNTLHDFIGKKMSEAGLNITNRYSPGYCNWSVAEQHKLFSFFPENFCGVTINESALMSPIKSVSGIIGIGKNVKWRDYTCDTCGIKDCTYRAKRIENIK